MPYLISIRNVSRSILGQKTDCPNASSLSQGYRIRNLKCIFPTAWCSLTALGVYWGGIWFKYLLLGEISVVLFSVSCECQHLLPLSYFSLFRRNNNSVVETVLLKKLKSVAWHYQHRLRSGDRIVSSNGTAEWCSMFVNFLPKGHELRYGFLTLLSTISESLLWGNILTDFIQFQK